MPPTIGAAIGFITSEPHSGLPQDGNQTSEHHPHRHQLGTKALHGAFDRRVLNVAGVEHLPGGEGSSNPHRRLLLEPPVLGEQIRQLVTVP